MTAFFILSGYALYLTYWRKDLTQIANIKFFYLKRLIGIFPLYYVISVAYIIFLGTENLKENFLLAPIEILGLQSVFTSIFSTTHNSGTWFVSCILICYLMYPFIQEIIKQISNTVKLVILFISTLVLLWSPFIVAYFKTGNIYSNPFFRMLEFVIGIILCSMKRDIEQLKKYKWLFSRVTVCIEFVILVIGVTLGIKLRIAVGDYMLYNWIALPMFSLLIISMAGIYKSVLKNNKVIKYLCNISYAFFFAQFFSWKITNIILDIVGKEDNLLKIVISFMVCFFMAVIMHEFIEKPITKLLTNILT